MPLNIPKEPKINTTIYTNFAGVDYTNDPSNIWYRRTATGTNMLPDEAGKPFKRTGWEIKITASQLANKYATDNTAPAPLDITIWKCHYFEIAGVDHIFIFTNHGLFIYRENQLLSSKDITWTYTENGSPVTKNGGYISYDSSLLEYEAKDRAFFFEGAGENAFYCYGGFKIWKYYYHMEAKAFAWELKEPYIPRVNISVDAKHETGQELEDINMLSDYIAEEFQNNTYLFLKDELGNPGCSIANDPYATVDVDLAIFLSNIAMKDDFQFIYSTDDHSWLLGGDQVQISSYGIALHTDQEISDSDTITVKIDDQYRINLPKPFANSTGMTVYVSRNTQFDTTYDTIPTSGTPSSSVPVVLKTPVSGNSYLLFYEPWLPLIDGADAIRVEYKRNAVSTSSKSLDIAESTFTATPAPTKLAYCPICFDATDTSCMYWITSQNRHMTMEEIEIFELYEAREQFCPVCGDGTDPDCPYWHIDIFGISRHMTPEEMRVFDLYEARANFCPECGDGTDTSCPYWIPTINNIRDGRHMTPEEIAEAGGEIL